jgi:Helix-turn-helix domain of resolvase
MPRPPILTHASLARVVTLVDHGVSAAEIAKEMGCTLGTLRVRCSHLGISLRRRAGGSGGKSVAAMDLVTRDGDGGQPVETSQLVVNESQAEVRVELKVLLPQITNEQLRLRGALRGISGSALAQELLVMIAREGLYDAVLDEG